METTGAPKVKIELIMHTFRTQLLPNVTLKRDRELTDEEYGQGLLKIKQETPFL